MHDTIFSITDNIRNILQYFKFYTRNVLMIILYYIFKWIVKIYKKTIMRKLISYYYTFIPSFFYIYALSLSSIIVIVHIKNLMRHG